MSGEVVTFGSLPVGAHFHMNGNNCVKNSSVTATLTQYQRTFYFSKRDVVTVGWAGEE